MNIIYVFICKVSQFLQILPNIAALSLLKRNFEVAILDFGGHFEFVSVLKVRN